MSESIGRAQLLSSTSAPAFVRAARVAFCTLSVVFLAATAWLASVTHQPGGWDSIAAQVAARNIAEGRGLVSEFVPNYVERYRLPGPEVTRAPGMSYLLGAAYRVFGVSMGVGVWVTGLIILLTAWVLWAGIRLDGGDWWADVAGMSMLIIRPPLFQVWNNGALMLTTAAMLALAVLAIRGRLTGVPLALLCAGVTAIGFYMKQTFMLSGAACTALLLLSDGTRSWRQRAIDGAVSGLVFLLLTSPYWLANLLQYGEPLYSPINRFHWPTRYGAYPWYVHHRAILFDQPYESLASVVDRVGVLEIFRGELNFMRHRAVALATPNPFLLIPAALGLLLFRKEYWRSYAAAATLTIGPMFDTMYWMVESRYLLPIFPCLLFFGWLAVRRWREWARAATPPALARRLSIGFGTVLVAAAVHVAVMGWPPLRHEIDNMRLTMIPPWKPVIERLPSDAVVMTDLPPAVSWWTRRKAIVTPLGDRADLMRVVELYHPQYHLDLGTELANPPLLAWEPGELERVSDGAGWVLHRIRVSSGGTKPTARVRAMPGASLTP